MFADTWQCAPCKETFVALHLDPCYATEKDLSFTLARLNPQSKEIWEVTANCAIQPSKRMMVRKAQETSSSSAGEVIRSCKGCKCCLS